MSKYGAFLLLCFGTYLISEVSGIKDPGYRGKPWYGKNKIKEATMIKKPVKDIGPPPGHPNYVAQPFRSWLPQMAERDPERYLAMYDTYYPNDEAGIHEQLGKLKARTGRLTRDSESPDVDGDDDSDEGNDDPGHDTEEEVEDDDVGNEPPPEKEEEEEDWRAKRRRMEKWRQEYLARRYSEHRQNLRNKFAGWSKHQRG